MSYTVRRSNGTTLVEVADQTINTADSSLNLVGRGAINYGQAFAENFVRLCEHFAHTVAPTAPLVGQIWHDTGTGTMKYWDGTAWKFFGSGGFGGTTSTTGGTTIAGTVVAAPRTAGATGVILVYNSTSTTVGVFLSEGKIMACVCMETIAFGLLPASVTIDGASYPFAARFTNGLSAGITMAHDNATTYVFAGTATSSQYADMAERYASDMPLTPGDVVELGGAAEVTMATKYGSTEVFGVVSTSPAVRLNDAAGTDDTHPFIALSGRVPCKVVGPVYKGQRLVSSQIPGVAVKAGVNAPYQAIIGRALATKLDEEVGVVEIVLGGVK